MKTINAQFIGLGFTGCRQANPAQRINLDFTRVKINPPAEMVDLNLTTWAMPKLGYIAGSADGILTVAGEPARRQILVLDADTSTPVKSVFSLSNGHYLADDLDPSREYLILGRDNERQYEPFAYDWIEPANDLTIAEQRELWNEFQID